MVGAQCCAKRTAGIAGGRFAAARQEFEKAESVPDLVAFWKRNERTFCELRDQYPYLKTDHDRHYSDFVVALYAAKLQTLALRDADSLVSELLSKVVYGLIMRRRDPGVLHLRI